MNFPYSRPYLDDNDASEVVKVLKQQYLTQGTVVTELEAALVKLFCVKHAIVCNSGTAALHMAYDGIGLGPTKGLITSSVTFVSTANAARLCGAPVGLADVDPVSGNVTVETIKAAVQNAEFETKAIAIVHLGGRPCAIVKISEYAESIGAYLIEDAAHAPMAQYSNQYNEFFSVGSCKHSTAATISFHAIKHVTTGEGGVLLTNDSEIADRAKKLRSHGIVRDASNMKNKHEAGTPWYYEMQSLGLNYRLSDINCALALSQIARLKKNIQRRQELARLYHSHLSGLHCVKLPSIPHSNSGTHAWHLFAPLFDFKKIGKSRQDVMLELSKNGVGTQVHYIPLYRQPYYRKNGMPKHFNGAEIYYGRTLSIPMYYGLTYENIELISKKIRHVLNS